MKKTIRISLLILIIGCNVPKQSLTTNELILDDLKEEYTERPEMKDRILKSIVNLQQNRDFVITSASFQSTLTGEYKALLYIIKNGAIIDKVERLNHKYHSGSFEISNDLENIENEVLYKILLPTSSVPHVVTLNEYFETNTKKKIISRFEFYSEERDCTMNSAKGTLIKRKIETENGSYFLNKSIYEFDCEDFQFEEEIENLNLITIEKEAL